jgi:hypothetical protein
MQGYMEACLQHNVPSLSSSHPATLKAAPECQISQLGVQDAGVKAPGSAGQGPTVPCRGRNYPLAPTPCPTVLSVCQAGVQ